MVSGWVFSGNVGAGVIIGVVGVVVIVVEGNVGRDSEEVCFEVGFMLKAGAAVKLTGRLERVVIEVVGVGVGVVGVRLGFGMIVLGRIGRIA
jgi:hypothetical protein